MMTRAMYILEKLVSFQSVVGTPNGDIVEWIADYLRSFGIAPQILPGPEGDRANLFATIGPADRSLHPSTQKFATAAGRIGYDVRSGPPTQGKRT